MIKTQFKKDNELVPLRWGWWHIAVFGEAIAKEKGVTVDDLPMNDYYPSNYVFKMEHIYEDESDGEILVINPGDEYNCWRD